MFRSPADPLARFFTTSKHSHPKFWSLILSYPFFETLAKKQSGACKAQTKQLWSAQACLRCVNLTKRQQAAELQSASKLAHSHEMNRVKAFCCRTQGLDQPPIRAGTACRALNWSRQAGAPILHIEPSRLVRSTGYSIHLCSGKRPFPSALFLCFWKDFNPRLPLSSRHRVFLGRSRSRVARLRFPGSASISF